MISSAIAVIVNTMAGLVLVHGFWWTTLCVVAHRRPHAGRPAPTSQPLTIAVLVPAHNEETLVAKCVSSIRRSSASAGLTARVVVIADNCTDATALVAARAGAAVVERQDQTRRGKPFALEHGLRHLGRTSPPDVVAFVDADCEVDDQFVTRLHARFAAGAEAVQCFYTSTGDSSVQRTRRLALMLLHWARPLGAERLGLGATVKGSGMAMRWRWVADGFQASGIAEDAELTLSLCRRGVRVEFEPDAVVTGHMASTLDSARTQDRRWEGGRLSLTPRAVATAFVCLAQRRVSLAAAALEVASPPLSLTVLAATATLAAALVGPGELWLAAAAFAALVTYVAVGLAAARPTLHELRALAYAPRFLLYKAGILVQLACGRRERSWQRTERT